MVITFAEEAQGYRHTRPYLASGAEAGEGGGGGEAVREAGQEPAAPVDAVLDEAETPPLPGGSEDRGQGQGGHQQHLNMRGYNGQWSLYNTRCTLAFILFRSEQRLICD